MSRGFAASDGLQIAFVFSIRLGGLGSDVRRLRR
jgi:hypothetical protein